ncbi:PREDICTED: uncharacterized protein LOC108967851 [Bactrocera latifrons]|uniref:Uncharacterized protein n=1 Tax=Bactrocera latifrons TaxID=174628 RepID=A0A0K8UQM9_BACLA|nr:PREDICTED: uncharacterized protein LOC108967851 [Bactrocera latifrons]XP_018787025.1 PREDICTED: uncharacterized protein LOC108967851 [Bactrocera latifrons]
MDETKGAMREQLGFQSQFNCKIKEHLTKFVVHRFTNKCVILVTQYGGIPNVYLVQFDASDERDKRISPLNISELHTSVPVTMKCLLGVDQMEVRAGIQFLINRTKLSQCKTEILITLGLRETNGDILKEIADILDRKAL